MTSFYRNVSYHYISMFLSFVIVICMSLNVIKIIICFFVHYIFHIFNFHFFPFFQIDQSDGSFSFLFLSTSEYFGARLEYKRLGKSEIVTIPLLPHHAVGSITEKKIFSTLPNPVSQPPIEAILSGSRTPESWPPQ